MIKLVRYPELGLVCITTNEWEVLFVLNQRGYATVGPHYWVGLTLLNTIIRGRYVVPIERSLNYVI